MARVRSWGFYKGFEGSGSRVLSVRRLSSGSIYFNDHRRSRVSVQMRWGTWCNNVHLGVEN